MATALPSQRLMSKMLPSTRPFFFSWQMNIVPSTRSSCTNCSKHVCPMVKTPTTGHATLLPHFNYFFFGRLYQELCQLGSLSPTRTRFRCNFLIRILLLNLSFWIWKWFFWTGIGAGSVKVVRFPWLYGQSETMANGFQIPHQREDGNSESRTIPRRPPRRRIPSQQRSSFGSDFTSHAQRRNSPFWRFRLGRLTSYRRLWYTILRVCLWMLKTNAVFYKYLQELSTSVIRFRTAVSSLHWPSGSNMLWCAETVQSGPLYQSTVVAEFAHFFTYAR